jgi:hypothetical protein
LGRNAGRPEIGLRGTEGEAVHALVERGQAVYVVADDLQVVNGHLEFLSLRVSRAKTQVPTLG